MFLQHQFRPRAALIKPQTTHNQRSHDFKLLLDGKINTSVFSDSKMSVGLTEDGIYRESISKATARPNARRYLQAVNPPVDWISSFLTHLEIC